jgi:hypothetical protein
LIQPKAAHAHKVSCAVVTLLLPAVINGPSTWLHVLLLPLLLSAAQ